MTRQKKGIHFDISERKILLRVFDIIFVFAMLFGISEILDVAYFDYSQFDFISSGVLVLYLSVFGTAFELYDLKKSSQIETVVNSIFLTSTTLFVFYLLTPFYTPELPENRLQILYFYLSIIIALVVWRWIYINIFSTPRFFKKVLFVGSSSDLPTLTTSLAAFDPNYKAIGLASFDEDKIFPLSKDLTYSEDMSIKASVFRNNVKEIVIINDVFFNARTYANLIDLLESGISIKTYSQVYEEQTKSIPVKAFGRELYKLFPFSRSNQNKLYLLFNRLLEVIISIIFLALCLALLPIILLGNLFGNKGDLFYTQERVGMNGKTFKIIKFRTMVMNAEKGKAQWAKKNDDRVTRFGKILRLTRIDEIPQCLNVLKGEMGIVGPRPERPYFVKKLSAEIPFYELRHLVKPGVTGWAQINTQYGASVEDSYKKLEYDLYYIKHRSFFLDINILIKTIGTVLFMKGQ